MTIALIDGDIVAFRVGFSCQTTDKQNNEVSILPIEIAYARANEQIENIIQAIGATKYQIFLTDSDGNFRKRVSEDYKANRKDVARPVHLKDLEEFMVQSWGAVRAQGEEADDLLGIEQTKHFLTGDERSVICSIDKDLLQIPGSHYNFVKNEFSEVSEDEGTYQFYVQLLMGDSTDNIKGCPGIGPAKAEKLLRPYFGDEEGMFNAVINKYKEKFPTFEEEEINELITTIGRLVYIRREEGKLWVPPTF